jgi:hypothetical protein
VEKDPERSRNVTVDNMWRNMISETAVRNRRFDMKLRA